MALSESRPRLLRRSWLAVLAACPSLLLGNTERDGVIVPLRPDLIKARLSNARAVGLSRTPPSALLVYDFRPLYLTLPHSPHPTPHHLLTMHDPFPLARPDFLVPYVQPVADFLNMKTLPLHFHEVLIAFTLYHSINRYVSPAISRYFFPRIYPSFNARTKLNWDVHVVSFVQSTLICGLALWVLWDDEELRQMDRTERVYGYTGASGLVQAFAGGYFLWDLMITVQNVRIFGIGMLFHAICALCVFSLGFVSTSSARHWNENITD